MRTQAAGQIETQTKHRIGPPPPGHFWSKKHWYQIHPQDPKVHGGYEMSLKLSLDGKTLLDAKTATAKLGGIQ